MFTRQNRTEKQKKVSIAIIILFVAWLLLVTIPFLVPKSGRLVIDLADITVYFERGLWLVNHTSPMSEYPQIPTALFGFNHLFSMGLEELHLQKFVYTAIFSLEMMIALYLSFKILLEMLPPERINVAYFVLLPPIIYYAACRFDILPALFCLIALNAVRKKRWMIAGFMLALATLTKWYPALIFPGFLIYASKQEGKFQWKMLWLFLLTGLLTVAASFLINGSESVLAPYVFQSSRYMEHIALPVLLENMFGNIGLINSKVYFMIFFILQISGSLLVFSIKLDSLDALSNYCVIVIGVFVLFSRIWSPQWFIWIILFLILSAKSLPDLLLIISYSSISYLNFPLLFDFYGNRSTPLIISGSITYLILMIIIIRALRNLDFQNLFSRSGKIGTI
jgi:hypothetical protein